MTVTFRDLTATAQRAGFFVTKYAPGRVTTYRIQCRDVDFFEGCCVGHGYGHLSTTSRTVAAAWLEGYLEGRASKPTPDAELPVRDKAEEPWRVIAAINDYGSIVTLNLDEEDGTYRGATVNFDRRPFGHLLDARGVRSFDELVGQRVRVHGDFGNQTIEFEDESDE